MVIIFYDHQVISPSYFIFHPQSLETNHAVILNSRPIERVISQSRYPFRIADNNQSEIPANRGDSYVAQHPFQLSPVCSYFHH